MQTSEQALQALLGEIFPESAGEGLLQHNLRDLGGDSIVAAGLAARIWRKWGISLPVVQLLRTPTFAALLPLLPDVPQESVREIHKVSTTEIWRQTSAQQMIYLEQARQPDSTAYNIPLVAAIPQAVSPQQFQRALQQTAERFPALFCQFYDEDGAFLFRYVGVSQVPLSRFESWQQACGQFVQPFKLDRDCLLRAALIPWDGQQTRLMLDFCHIAADGLSVGYFLEQLRAALLLAPQKEEEASDVFAWSRWVEGETYAAQQQEAARYWQRHLTPAVARPRWPLQQAASPQGLDYAMQQVQLDRTLCKAIRLRADENAVTPFTLFLLAWALLQGDVTGCWQGRVGLVTSGRHDPAWQHTFGMFVNTLILPVALSPQQRLDEALQALAGHAHAALAHQHYPFAAQRELLGERTDALDALFAFQNIDYQNIDLLGGQFRAFWEAKRMAQFGMVLHIFDRASQGYEIQWEHAPTCFSAALVQSLLGRYREILQALATLPGHLPLERCLEINEESDPVQGAVATVDFNFS